MKRRRDPQGTRERLVRAALDLFTTQGYHLSTTPQIAARAGVAEGTIYRHFASKSQMLNEIYRGAVDLFARVIDEQAGERTATYEARLTTIARRWLDVASRERELVKLVFVAPPMGELDGKSQVAFATMRTSLERLLASGKSAGEVRPGPVEVWSDVWFQLIKLVLERVATGTWAAGQSAPEQVIRCAWAAVAVPSAIP